MIKPKNKPCIECGEFRPWFSKERCKSCAQKSYSKPKAVSNKRKEQLKDYSVLRKEFLEANPNCQAKLVGCNIVATDIHHANGRTNEKLNDTKHWLALCRSCHDKTHGALSASEARKLGLKE